MIFPLHGASRDLDPSQLVQRHPHGVHVPALDLDAVVCRGGDQQDARLLDTPLVDGTHEEGGQQMLPSTNEFAPGE